MNFRQSCIASQANRIFISSFARQLGKKTPHYLKKGLFLIKVGSAWLKTLKKIVKSNSSLSLKNSMGLGSLPERNFGKRQLKPIWKVRCVMGVAWRWRVFWALLIDMIIIFFNSVIWCQSYVETCPWSLYNDRSDPHTQYFLFLSYPRRRPWLP